MDHKHAEKITEDAIKHYKLKAEAILGFRIPNIECNMSYRKSTIGGKAHIGDTRFDRYRITVNIPLLAYNDDELAIMTTVGHEIAHLVAFKKYNDRGHGRMWKTVMIQFGLEPERCHTMNDAAGAVGKNTTVYVYQCQGCGEYCHMGKKRHNNHQRFVKWGASGYSHCRRSGLNFIAETDKVTYTKFRAGEISSLTNKKDKTSKKSIDDTIGVTSGRAVESMAPARSHSKQRSRKTSGRSKLDQARTIYGTMKTRTRKETIERFVNEIGMTPAGAATYYAKIKKER